MTTAHVTEWVIPDVWLILNDKNGGFARVMADEESAIDAAVSKFLETKQDALLHIRFVEGEEYVTLASDITSWYRSTPEFRARAELVEEKVKAEKKANGWSDDE